MNGDKKMLDVIVENLNKANCANTDVVVAPPTAYLSYVRGKLDGKVCVAAQNSYKVHVIYIIKWSILFFLAVRKYQNILMFL